MVGTPLHIMLISDARECRPNVAHIKLFGIKAVSFFLKIYIYHDGFY